MIVGVVDEVPAGVIGGDTTEGVCSGLFGGDTTEGVCPGLCGDDWIWFVCSPLACIILSNASSASMSN